MKIYCLILARKNSKRIKKKNMISFFKKPLIYWTLKNAFNFKKFNKVILSSDWDELLSYAKKNFASTILDKRKPSIAISKTKSESVIKYLLNKYKITNGITLLLQPTSPLRKTHYIKNMLKLFKKKKLKTLISVSNVKNKTEVNYLNNIYNLPKKFKPKKLYYNGSIYIFKTSFFLKKKILSEKPGNFFFHKKIHSLDLDTVEDLKKFRLKYHINKKNLLVVN